LLKLLGSDGCFAANQIPIDSVALERDEKPLTPRFVPTYLQSL